MKWLLFKRVKSVKTTLTEWKLLLKRVKIIPKWVKITPKRMKITPIEWISLFGEAHKIKLSTPRLTPFFVFWLNDHLFLKKNLSLKDPVPRALLLSASLSLEIKVVHSLSPSYKPLGPHTYTKMKVGDDPLGMTPLFCLLTEWSPIFEEPSPKRPHPSFKSRSDHPCHFKVEGHTPIPK